MRHTSIAEAKAHFSALVKRAEAGEEILVTRGGTAVACIVPVRAMKERTFANDEGLGFVADDFNEPLPAEILKEFYD